MNPVGNHLSLIYFPEDLQKYITKKIHVSDINACMRVSKLWNKVFSSDPVWERFIDELDRGRELIYNNNKFQYPLKMALLTIFSTSYKARVHEHFMRKVWDIAKCFPMGIVKALGGIDSLRRLPGIKMREYDVVVKECFTAPIVLAVYKPKYVKMDHIQYLERKSCLLLRICNNETNKIFYDYLEFTSKEDGFPRDLDVCYVTNTKDKCKPKIYPKKYNGNDYYFGHCERLSRLVNNQPVGMLVEVKLNTFQRNFPSIFSSTAEGKRHMEDGKSVLELC